MTRNAIIFCLALLALLLNITDALAQFGRPSGGGRGGRAERSGPPANRGMKPLEQDLDSPAQIEYRLALLEDDLFLKPEQNAPWQTFADKVRAYAGDVRRERERAEVARASAAPAANGIQQLEHLADAAQNRAQAMDEIATAAKALYATLSDEQKRIVDARIATIVAPNARSVAPPSSGSVPPDAGPSRPEVR